MKWKTVMRLAVLALFAAGCNVGGSDGSEPAAQEPTVEFVDELSSGIAGQAIARDSTQLPPTPDEEFTLDQQDLFLRAAIVPSNRFQLSIQRVVAAAGIAADVEIFVDNDFRASQIPARGGVAGHSLFVIDGKFLDILGDFSNYLALANAGIVFEDPAFALDTIVNWHNSSPPGPAVEVYPYQFLTPNQQALSDRFLDSYAGAITYHEFAHYYLYHSLDRLRSQGTLDGLVIQYTSLNEDDADGVAGMLMRKAGYDIVFGREMVDIMAFYALNQTGAVTSIIQIVASLPAQFIPNATTYSSLSVRKQLFADGYARYDRYLREVSAVTA